MGIFSEIIKQNKWKPFDEIIKKHTLKTILEKDEYIQTKSHGNLPLLFYIILHYPQSTKATKFKKFLVKYKKLNYDIPSTLPESSTLHINTAIYWAKKCKKNIFASIISEIFQTKYGKPEHRLELVKEALHLVKSLKVRGVKYHLDYEKVSEWRSIIKLRKFIKFAKGVVKSDGDGMKNFKKYVYFGK